MRSLRIDYFKLFNLKKSYRIDKTILKFNYKLLYKKYDPKKCMSTELNITQSEITQAYRTLLHPIYRAKYMYELSSNKKLIDNDPELRSPVTLNPVTYRTYRTCGALSIEDAIGAPSIERREPRDPDAINPEPEEKIENDYNNVLNSDIDNLSELIDHYYMFNDNERLEKTIQELEKKYAILDKY
jgi:hypothetical protein